MQKKGSFFQKVFTPSEILVNHGEELMALNGFRTASSMLTWMMIGHCDIPCGIYNPKPALLAAETVSKMVLKIQQLPPTTANSSKADLEAYHNSVARMAAVKEEHAQLCKKELLVLWTDYFKDEHTAMFPDLHTTFWTATKLCSKNKQNVDAKAAEDLYKAVEHIAKMFEQAEAAKKK